MSLMTSTETTGTNEEIISENVLTQKSLRLVLENSLLSAKVKAYEALVDNNFDITKLSEEQRSLIDEKEELSLIHNQNN